MSQKLRSLCICAYRIMHVHNAGSGQAINSVFWPRDPGCIPCKLNAEDTPIFTIFTIVFLLIPRRISLALNAMECSL